MSEEREWETSEESMDRRGDKWGRVSEVREKENSGLLHHPPL